MKRIFALLLVFALCAGCLGGYAATALETLTQKAEAGDAEAMYRLGSCYYNGSNGAPQDYAAAGYWWFEAANKGHAGAMYGVGYLYRMGLGFNQDLDASRTWWEKGADAGDPTSAYALGLIYKRGNGVSKDTGKAQKYFLRALERGYTPYDAQNTSSWTYSDMDDADAVLAQANAGNRDAMCTLGYMYLAGWKIGQDDALAAYWWYKAADAGLALAMINTAYMFCQGRGTEQNLEEAQRWIKKFVATEDAANAAPGDSAAFRQFLKGSSATAKPAAKTTAKPTAKATAKPTAKPKAKPTAKPMARGTAMTSFLKTPGTRLNATVAPASSQTVDIDRGRPAEMMRLLGLDNLVEAAVMGDLDAAYILGWCFYYGEGVGQDYEESFGWFLRLAEEGDPAAYIWAGDAYYYGWGTDQDYDQALKWYLLAAEEDDSRAMHMLGVMYREGQGVKQDGKKADKWLQRAADAGYIGQDTTMEDIKGSVSATATPKTAKKATAKATAKPKATKKATAKATAKPKAAKKATATPVPRSKIDIDAGQPEKMMKLLGIDGLVDAYSMGDLDAAYVLGWCYYYGKGSVKQDYARAFEWFYALANDEDDPRAYLYVADAYYNGQGVKRNYTEAVRWYEKAALEGDGKICNRLGNYYYEGKIVQQDYAKALKWYLLGAENGNATAMCSAAGMYERGDKGVKQDLAKAAQLYKKAAELGDVTSMNNLGAMYINGKGVSKNAEQGIYWFTQAANSGSDTAMYNLGLIYEKGLGGVQKNASKARSWYEKAAAAGNENAKKKLK